MATSDDRRNELTQSAAAFAKSIRATLGLAEEPQEMALKAAQIEFQNAAPSNVEAALDLVEHILAEEDPALMCWALGSFAESLLATHGSEALAAFARRSESNPQILHLLCWVDGSEFPEDLWAELCELVRDFYIAAYIEDAKERLASYSGMLDVNDLEMWSPDPIHENWISDRTLRLEAQDPTEAWRISQAIYSRGEEPAASEAIRDGLSARLLSLADSAIPWIEEQLVETPHFLKMLARTSRDGLPEAVSQRMIDLVRPLAIESYVRDSETKMSDQDASQELEAAIPTHLSFESPEDLPQLEEFLSSLPTAKETDDSWASSWVDDFEFDHEHEPELMWQLILDLLAQFTAAKANVAILAAGPMETFIVNHGTAYLDRIEDRARTDPSFNHLLGGVWQNDIPDDLWARITACRNEVW